MPLKLNLGLTKKIGLPNYGSLGACCQIEIELDQSLLTTDLAGLERRIRQVYAVCGEAVSEELSKRQPGKTQLPACQHRARDPDPVSADSPAPAESGDAAAPPPQRASERQLTYARQLAGKIHGLGGRRLETLAQQRCGRPLHQLSAAEAGQLITTLQQIQQGKLDLLAVMAQAAEAN